MQYCQLEEASYGVIKLGLLKQNIEIKFLLIIQEQIFRMQTFMSKQSTQ